MQSFKQTRKLIGRWYRSLFPTTDNEGHPIKSDKAYDVLDYKLIDKVGNVGDLHIHIEHTGEISFWSNTFKVEQNFY